MPCGFSSFFFSYVLVLPPFFYFLFAKNVFKVNSSYSSDFSGVSKYTQRVTFGVYDTKTLDSLLTFIDQNHGIVCLLDHSVGVVSWPL